MLTPVVAFLLMAAPAVAAEPGPARVAPAPAAVKPPVGKIVLPPLSYTIEKSGPADGPHPRRTDFITVNYKLTLLDGTVLDGTEGKGPANFPLGQIIPAWQVLVQLMRPGDAWTFYVPPEYAYGAAAREGLPANSFLTFQVELVTVGTPQAEIFRQEE